jgi:hypothetical protein
MVFSFQVAAQREPHVEETGDGAVPKGPRADQLPIKTRSGTDYCALHKTMPATMA